MATTSTLYSTVILLSALIGYEARGQNLVSIMFVSFVAVAVIQLTYLISTYIIYNH